MVDIIKPNTTLISLEKLSTQPSHQKSEVIFATTKKPALVQILVPMKCSYRTEPPTSFWAKAENIWSL